MQSASRHILLISYVFPPYYGIGGRRWAKHANELTKLGYTIHVICAKNPFRKKSLWNDIVEHNSKIILYPISGRFPKVLVKSEHTLLQKLFYKIWINILPFFTKGSYLDRTIFWKKLMLRTAAKIITENKIKSVICSGGPFGAMYYTTLLRQKFADIFIINDLRDPWTWGPNWGFDKLVPKRMNYELMLELETVRNSDIITVPTLEMKKYLDKKYPAFNEKIKILHHFFDSSEIRVQHKTKSEKLRLILYGSIYHHISYLIEEAAKTMTKYSEQVTLDIYTDKKQYHTAFKKYGAGNVTFHDVLPPAELFKLFKNYDYVFLMIPSVGVDHISTKFFEIIYSQTPFFIFCKNGLAPEFIVKNHLGIHAAINQLDETLNKLIGNKEFPNYNRQFDLSPYSIENNAKQISAMLR